MEDATHIALPRELVDSLLSYLNTKPRLEVQRYFEAVTGQGRPVSFQPKAVDGEESDGESQTG